MGFTSGLLYFNHNFTPSSIMTPIISSPLAAFIFIYLPLISQLAPILDANTEKHCRNKGPARPARGSSLPTELMPACDIGTGGAAPAQQDNTVTLQSKLQLCNSSLFKQQRDYHYQGYQNITRNSFEGLAIYLCIPPPLPMLLVLLVDR